MVGRCHNPNWNNYFTKTYYKDKGITVCDEWRNCFDVFKKWALENGYSDGLSIDRVDEDGNYEPSNCRWITYEENRRRALANARSKTRNSKSSGTKSQNRVAENVITQHHPNQKWEVRECGSHYGRWWIETIRENYLTYSEATQRARQLTEEAKHNYSGRVFVRRKMEKGSEIDKVLYCGDTFLKQYNIK